jgi:1-acyl-sn-glycerol-3-phosphate acyltransferase
VLRLFGSSVEARLVSGCRAMVEVAYAAWFWVTLAIAALIVWPLVALRWPGSHWRVFRRAARMLLGLWRLPIETRGAEAVSGPAVLIANHKSYLDGLVLAAVLPGEVTFVAKSELASGAFTRVFLKRLGAIFVERFDPKRGAEDARRIRAAARAGARLLFFPEGTTLHPRGLAAFRLGAFSTAADVELPLVPITIRGTDDVLPGHHWFPRRRQVRVVVGAAIAPRGREWKDALALRDAARRTILSELGEPDLAFRGPALRDAALA